MLMRHHFNENGKFRKVTVVIITFLLLFGIQLVSGKVGYFIAAMIPYRQMDIFDSFANISIHHVVQLLIAIIIILVLSKRLHLDFYFQLGDKKQGIISLAIFTVTFTVISLTQHAFMAMNHHLPVYDFPLDTRNVLGTLGFQLILSGPTEEVVYRALPIVLLSHAFGRSIKIKGYFTLEVMLSSVLFTFAHVRWSLIPLTFDANYMQIMYTCVLGTIQGITFQRSRSILYPVLMHSFSNILMVGGGYLFTVWFN